MADDKGPANPRPAATILLLRDNPVDGRSEVFMVVRHHQIDFASGALVFPGGKTNESDLDPRVRRLCDGAEGLDEENLALAVSAIREAFEESGVLLARPNGKSDFIGAERVKELEEFRTKLDKQEVSIFDFLNENGLRLACDSLVPFAHWITPEFMPKRFDTHFFLAIAPADHIALHDGSETVDSVWLNPVDALAEAKEGKWTIIFPTRMNLEMLGRNPTAETAILAAQNSKVVTVLPKLVKRDGESFLQIPKEANYIVSETSLDNI